MTTIKTRRGTASQWTAANPILAEGEAGYELDTRKIKFGDGITRWNSLSYQSGPGVNVPPAPETTKVLTPLSDQMDGVRPGRKVPTTKAQVSLVLAAADPGPKPYSKFYMPAQMYDIADVNWSADTLQPYSQAFINMPKSNGIGVAFDFTTMFEGTSMAMEMFKSAGIAQQIRIWIDDEEVTDWFLGTRGSGVLQTDKKDIDVPASHDNGLVWLNILFAKRGIYKVRVSGIITTGIYCLLATDPDGFFQKPKKQRTFAVISDSWYDSIAANTSYNGATILSALMGWRCWNLAVGGSGFVNPGPDNAKVQNYSSDAVFERLSKAPELELLLLNGSVNDLGYTETEVLNAMRSFFARWKSVRPDVPIVWQGLEIQSYFTNIYTRATVKARETAQRAVALAEPQVIGAISSANEDWLTGTGNVGAPAGNGNQDWVIGLDTVHLSPFGVEHNGSLVFERIKSMKTWRP